MDENIEYKLPLGLCKQAVMKLDSFITDLYEIRADEEVDPEDAFVFEQMTEIAGTMAAALVNIIAKEIGEEEFLNEDIAMDVIDTYPGDDIEVIDQVLDID